MNHSELLLILKDKLNPEQGFAYNERYVANQRQEWASTQPFNTQPVIISLRKETHLEKEYPSIPPSTSSNTDNNPNNYFPVSEFKIGLRDRFFRKK